MVSYPWTNAQRGIMTPNSGDQEDGGKFSAADLKKFAEEAHSYKTPFHEMPWQVENDQGVLIGGYDNGREAFAAAGRYLESVTSEAKAVVVYPDGYRLTERKSAAAKKA